MGLIWQGRINLPVVVQPSPPEEFSAPVLRSIQAACMPASSKDSSIHDRKRRRNKRVAFEGTRIRKLSRRCMSQHREHGRLLNKKQTAESAAEGAAKLCA